jgi:hypothetical protein
VADCRCRGRDVETGTQRERESEMPEIHHFRLARDGTSGSQTEEGRGEEKSGRREWHADTNLRHTTTIPAKGRTACSETKRNKDRAMGNGARGEQWIHLLYVPRVQVKSCLLGSSRGVLDLCLT